LYLGIFSDNPAALPTTEPFPIRSLYPHLAGSSSARYGRSAVGRSIPAGTRSFEGRVTGSKSKFALGRGSLDKMQTGGLDGQTLRAATRQARAREMSSTLKRLTAQLSACELVIQRVIELD
jgi:hypothetical protein